MCFYDDDDDWYASIVEDSVIEVTSPVRCDECGRSIPPGSWRRHIFMQQDEYCRHDPEGGRYDAGDTAEAMGVDVDALPEEGCPPGCEHDYGETCEYDRCEACDQLIEAIHRHELDEGCREYESRPALEELHQAMWEGDGAAYLAKAESLYPGITSRLPESFLEFRERIES